MVGRNLLASNLKMIEKFCNDWSLSSSEMMAFNVQTLLEHHLRRHTFLEIAARLDAILASILDEARLRLYFTVPSDLSAYYDKDHLFGGEVFHAFPSARYDVKEAGKCLACGNNSAAGFHLMRASEIGLWELGRDRQIPLAVSGKIQFQEWGTIIGELETAVKAIQQWPNSHTKEEAHKFYNSVLVDIRAFNDGWWRHLAHVRTTQKPIENAEALALFGHVSTFLALLATKIGEGKYTPLIW